jgi:hypothetical protein
MTLHHVESLSLKAYAALIKPILPKIYLPQKAARFFTLLAALGVVGLFSASAIVFYYDTLSFYSEPDTIFLAISTLAFLEFVVVASGRSANTHISFLPVLAGMIFVAFLFNLDIGWQHRKHLYEKIQTGITDIEYCGLSYTDKLIIETLSTRGITECQVK